MEQEHRKAIQSNFTTLVERTDLDSVVTSLYEKGVFAEQMIEPYRDENEPQRERKRKLFRDVTKRGPLAFGHLVDTLSELGYWDIVRDLDPNSPFSAMSRPPISSNPIQREPKPRPNEDFVSISEARRPKNTLPKTANTPALSDLDNATASKPDIPEFKVIKSTEFRKNDDALDIKQYHTRGQNRGNLVVFSYMSFKDDIEDFRNGVDVDCAMLKNLFLEIGFRVVSYPNLDYQETVDTLKGLKDVLVDVESVFIVVSSHGYERRDSSDIDIRCSDGRLISFYNIIEYFNNANMPQLIGVPKVFIFQTCRGRNEDYVWSTTPSPPRLRRPLGEVFTDGTPVPPASAAAANTLRSPHAPDKMPLYSDILIAHSTLPGHVSRRDGKLGSWYIQVLCEVFASKAHNTHVDKLFTLVDIGLKERFEVQTSSIDRWGFNKRLYLHPGLFE